MILTQEYSRIAAEFTVSVEDALKILGIEGTGSFEGDKKLIRSLALKYHSDVNKDPKDIEKMHAVNTLLQVYIRNGRELPKRNQTRQQPSQTRQPYRAPGVSSGPLSASDMPSTVQEGYRLASEFLNLCNSWLSNKGNCRSIKEDLRGNLFKDFEQVMKAMNTGPNRKTHLNFVRILNSFELVYHNILRLVAYCRTSNGRDNQVSGYVSGLKFRIEQLLQFGR